MSEKTVTTKPLGTINGKEYVDTRLVYTYRAQDTNDYHWYTATGYDYDNGICEGNSQYNDKGKAYDVSCALIQIIANLEKNLTEHILTLDRKLRAVDEHIHDDIFTVILKKHKQVAAQLQEKLESAESSNKELTAQLAQVTEERNKLQEWKARMQKQFE